MKLSKNEFISKTQTRKRKKSTGGGKVQKSNRGNLGNSGSKPYSLPSFTSVSKPSYQRANSNSSVVSSSSPSYPTDIAISTPPASSSAISYSGLVQG